MYIYIPFSFIIWSININPTIRLFFYNLIQHINLHFLTFNFFFFKKNGKIHKNRTIEKKSKLLNLLLSNQLL
jgi:hypothetical protein